MWWRVWRREREEKQGDRNEDRERDKLNTHMYVQNEKKRGGFKKNWSNLHWKVSKEAKYEEILGCTILSPVFADDY